MVESLESLLVLPVSALERSRRAIGARRGRAHAASGRSRLLSVSF
jgi:hypothetical protein